MAGFFVSRAGTLFMELLSHGLDQACFLISVEFKASIGLIKMLSHVLMGWCLIDHVKRIDGQGQQVTIIASKSDSESECLVQLVTAYEGVQGDIRLDVPLRWRPSVDLRWPDNKGIASLLSACDKENECQGKSQHLLDRYGAR